MTDTMTETVVCTRCGQRFDAGETGCPACGHLLQSTECKRHPDRSAGGVCVICGDAVCDECNGSTDPGYSCPIHQDIPLIEGWAQVYVANEDVEAQLIRDNLRAEGIDAEVLSQRDQTFRVDLGELAPVRVLVPAFDYLSAMELLAGHRDPTGELSFACEACGEAFEAGQERCTQCGAALPSSSA